jgi:hypothetical protein
MKKKDYENENEFEKNNEIKKENQEDYEVWNAFVWTWEEKTSFKLNKRFYEIWLALLLDPFFRSYITMANYSTTLPGSFRC